MEKRFHFISGLPRSGSTLLAAVLQQNPRFHAGLMLLVDCENVHCDAPAFDAPMGLSGLHKERPRVSLEPRRSILPPDLFEQYSKLSFWEDKAGSAANVIRATPVQVGKG